ARIVDLHGRMVLPGFYDAHSHPMSGGMALLRCSLADMDSVAKIRAQIRACAKNEPKEAWLMGAGWKRELFGPGGPSRKDLDELVPDRPAYFTTGGGFVAWVNSAALAAAGIDATTAATLDGMRLDSNGKPSGMIEGSANELVRRKIPSPSLDQYR